MWTCIPISVWSGSSDVYCEVLKCISTAQARTKCGPGGLAKTPLLAICTEILPWGLLQRSCQQSSGREILYRSHKDILPRDLLYRSCPGGLAKRPLLEICTEILPRSLLQKSCPENSSREPVQRFHNKRSCTETLHRDLLRPCQEAPYSDLAKRHLIGILYRDLARTPLIKTLYRNIA